MAQNKKKVFIGIDVSKDTLDIYLESKAHKIKNNQDCIQAFIDAEIDKQHEFLCVMESTGGYERTALQIFVKNNIPTHVAHPNRVHAFAKASGHFAKTDKLDAMLLCKYAAFIAFEESGDIVIDQQHQEIIALRRLARSLEESLHAAQCKVGQMPQNCKQHLNDEIAFYKTKIAQIQAEIDQKIDTHPDLKEKRDIMTTMKGVGNKSAAILLAELPTIGTFSRQKIASLVGVAPKTYQSGKKTSPGHIAGGRFYARKALYMIALVAMQHNQDFKNRYNRLIEKGKAKKVALVALMRDAIIILNAMIKNRRKYQHTC